MGHPVVTLEALHRRQTSPWAVLAVGGAALLVGTVAVRDSRSALVLALLPALALLLSRPRVAAVAGVALIPWVVSVSAGLPVHLDPSDLLMFLAVGALFLAVAAGQRAPELASLRPAMPFVAAYAAALGVATVAHLNQKSLTGSVQRLQLVVLPLVIGAAVLTPPLLRRALGLYVASACLLAVTTELGLVPAAFGFQKNPVGQFIASALLIAVGTTIGGRYRFLALPLLAFGLLRSESRGAVLGFMVGLACLLIVRGGLSRLRLVAYLLPLLAVLVVSFASLPDDVRQRTTTLSSSAAGQTGVEGEGASTIALRETYRNDAERIIRAHPLSGVGIGNYLAGSLLKDTVTDDPHNVLLLEFAEGGLVLISALLLLVVGSAAAVYRQRRLTSLAALAVALQAALFAHGVVDVYWVRGTPVLGWLVLGAALREAWEAKQA